MPTLKVVSDPPCPWSEAFGPAAAAPHRDPRQIAKYGVCLYRQFESAEEELTVSDVRYLIERPRQREDFRVG
jgi:hypothetical protein